MKDKRGITLIALIITIIVLLILAGVSMNAIIGDNGIITQAQKATEKTNQAKVLEALNTELVHYSTLGIIGTNKTQDELIVEISEKLIEKGILKSVDKFDYGNGLEDINKYEDENKNLYFLGRDDKNYEYRIYVNENGTYQAELSQSQAGGTLKGGTYKVTADAFSKNDAGLPEKEKGKFTINNPGGVTTVIFAEELGSTGKSLCILVKKGTKAKIYMTNPEYKTTNKIYHYNLNNSGLERSAIDIELGAQLDLYIGEGVVVNVDSGKSGKSQPANLMNYNPTDGIIGGSGAYAGIHVPRKGIEVATLKLHGEGKLIAKAGDAGCGGDGGYNNLDWGGSRRRTEQELE